MNAKTTVLFVALTAALGGCASTPATVPELENARAEVRSATADPLAQEAAGVAVKKAEENLQTAEQLFAKHAPLVDIKHQAFIAARYAQIAQAQTKEAHARKEVAAGEAERNRVLLEARTRQADQAVAQTAAARAQTAQAQSETARAQMGQAQSEAERDQAQSDTARAQMAQAQSDAQRDQALADANKLRDDMSALQAIPTERGMVLTLGDVLFDTARATLKPGAAVKIDRLAEFMKAHTSYDLLVEGHADSQGSDEYNLNLSAQRAMAVQAALVARDVDSRRVRTKGLGENYPVASNDNAAGRQQNRRVEVVFSDDHGKFMPAAERSASR